MRKKALAKALRNPTNGVGVLGAWRLACCCFAPRPGRLACSTDRVRGGGGSRARPFPNWNGCFHLLLLSLSIVCIELELCLLLAGWVPHVSTLSAHLTPGTTNPHLVTMSYHVVVRYY